jgi:DNA polymerase III sliding clamp (beta) subunit (PCNA family)
MTINKVLSLSTRDFADAVNWAAKTSGGQIRMDVGKDDTVLYFSSFIDTNSSKAKIDSSFVSGKQGDHTFVVSSSLLKSSLKLLKGSEFTLTVSSSQVVLKAGRNVVNLPVIKGGNEIIVPPLPPVAGRVSIVDFRKAISAVTLAASSDDSAIALMSIHCEFSPKERKVTFVATDRYKMMLRTIPFEPIDDTVDNFSMNIMASSMKTLSAGLPATDATIDVHTEPGGSQLVIRDVNYMSGVGVIDGEFVQYGNFLKMPFASKIKVELSELKGAIDGITMLLTGDEGITLTFSQGECVVSSVHNVGSTVCTAEGVIEPVPATDPLAEPEEPSLRVVFGSKIIRPCLSSLSAKFVELHYNKPTSPWVIKELDEATGKALDSSFTLLMPVRA